MGLFGPSTKAEYDTKIAKKEIECAKQEKIAAGGFDLWGTDKNYAKQRVKELKADIKALKAKRSLCKK